MRLAMGGVHSHVGKTTIVAGLITSLRKRGFIIQPFKVGPDYIDPSYHALAAGRPCLNLDTWMIPPEGVTDLFNHYAHAAEFSIIEGVMGMFDGQNYKDDTGSTAQVAKLTQTPAILVIDASVMARSAAAIAIGYQHFDPELHLAGFIINNVAGQAHGQGVADAIEQATGLPVLGWLPHSPKLIIAERHLGLVPTVEAGGWQDFIESSAAFCSRYLDIDHLIEIAQSAPAIPVQEFPIDLSTYFQPGGPSNHPLIAVARDEAFSFTYQENIDLLRAAGAEITFFSPLHDTALPIDTCGIILSGGFPELYAAEIGANRCMHQAIHNAHEHGLPIYAECGGLMALTQSIIDLQGKEYPMIGLLPGQSVMTKQLHMGYRLARAAVDSWLLHQGEAVRGHEFHYSAWEGFPENLPPAYHLSPASGKDDPKPEGVCMGSLWASYVHLSFWAKPELAFRFVDHCRKQGQ